MMSLRLKIAKQAITKAGDYLKDQFHKRHSVSIKEDKTVLIGEDIKSEDILISTISESFPKDSFFTEEKETKIKSEYVWILDPLCGTYSYLRGAETWSLSIALVSDNQYLIGVVYQPLLGNLFYSEKGRGAFLDKKLIQPSNIKNISEAFVAVEHGVFQSNKINLMQLIKDIKRLRVGHGSGGELGYVASGFIDALIKTDQSLEHFAGGRAIVEEAGGSFIDFAGNKAPTYLDKGKTIDYIASNKYLASKLLDYVL